MCFCNTTNIIINGARINSGCCGFPSFGMMMPTTFSPGCFGYGFSNSGGNMFEMGAGIGLGYAAGMALIPALPSVFKGVGQACSWAWNKAIVPAGKAVGQACSWVWNKALYPAGKAIFNGVKSAVNWVGNGIKSAWNWITGKNK